MSALVIKVIKPSKLNEAAMRLQLLNDMRKVGTAMKASFAEVTATWKTEVLFEVQISLAGGPQVEVFTTNKIWDYVDRGTPPHVIRPKNAKALRFQSGYAAKTTPGVIGSSAGGPFGPVVFSKGVNHPGNQPGGFTKEIQKIWTPKFKRTMEASMVKVAKASGHDL